MKSTPHSGNGEEETIANEGPRSFDEQLENDTHVSASIVVGLRLSGGHLIMDYVAGSPACAQRHTC